MSTQINQARKAGYSDQEIVDYLSKKDPSQAEKFKTAKQNGYSPEEILNHLHKPTEPQKKQEPLTLKGAAQAFGSGLGGGAGGLIGDVTNLVEPVKGISPVAQALGNLQKVSGIKGTEELTKSLEGEGPQNALERILQKSGEFGGQEGLIGTAVGGPVGGALGGVHGAISGTFYGAAKELGASDEVALLAALATVSPIAAERLISKLSKGKAAQKVLKGEVEAVKEVVSKGEPPPPPGGFGPGSVLPETRSTFNEKEGLIQKLEEKPQGSPLGINAQFPEVKTEAPSLAGRVSEAPELGEVISKEPFHSEAQVSRNVMKDVGEAFRDEKAIVKDEYAKAEEITKTHNDTFPQLAKENDARIDKLEQIPKRSEGEEAVYKDALALRKIIGQDGGLIEANASQIMKQANSFSQKVNYELPYAGYKGQIKEIVHQMNNAVINSLERAGLNAQQVIRADKTYGRFADRFMNDEISPYLARRPLNPEELGRRAINDEGSYRAIKKALGSRQTPLVAKIDREVVHQKMDKYYKNPEKVNSKEYQKDLKNLAERIGKERIADIDHFLRQRQLNHERKLLGERKIKETQLAREKLPPKGQPTSIEKRITNEPMAKTPEELDKLFNKPSDIRRLKRQVKDKGLEKEFDKLVEKKIEEIFKEGGFGEKKITGLDMQRIIDKNHEVLTELMEEQEVRLLYKAAREAGKQEITQEIIKHVIKAAGKTVAQFLGVGKLIKLIPLSRV